MYWKTKQVIEDAFNYCKNTLNDLANYLESQVKYTIHIDCNSEVDSIINMDEIQKHISRQIKKVTNKIAIITKELDYFKEEK